ncbi:MAG: NUDIX domain-containing protein [Erythrobacter sp.]|uniref:NUDIX hydrolase n=1 Tax=Erythrobacter sp. TaxID=1042 RepID=UPI003C744BB4
MLHLIERLLPAWLHRALLPLAHRIRHRWRGWRGSPLEGVSVIITDDQDRLLLLRHSYGPKVWALPGGGLDRGEDPVEAARREMREELQIELDQVQSLGTLEESLSGARHTAHLFSARASSPPVPDMREIVEARFFALEAMPSPRGTVTDRRIEAWKRGLSERRQS